jgi:putative ABC transport system permease protein
MIREFIRRLSALLRGKRLGRELDDELRFHVEKQTEANIAAGMAPEEARRQALVALGGIDKTREEYRDALGWRLLSDFAQDVRYALRQMRRSPGFTMVAVLTLALGIGANSGIFSTVNAVVLHPLPFPHLNEIVTVWEIAPNALDEQDRTSFANFLDWKQQARAFRDMAAYRRAERNLTGQGEPLVLRACLVTPEFFPLLEGEPLLGRKFSAEESQRGNERVAIISHGFWQEHLGAPRGVIGQSLSLNESNYAIIGVMPAEFDFPPGTQVWLPLAPTPEQIEQRGERQLLVLGRLAPGVSLAAGGAQMSALHARLARQYPFYNAGRDVRLVPLREYVSYGSRRFILVLMAAAVFVLLLACANVANLQLARAAARQKEIAVRTALGAGRLRVTRQLLTESLVLSLIGALVGLLFASWMINYMKNSVPPDIARHVAALKQVRINGPVLLFTLFVAALAAMVSGLAAALHAASPNLSQTLRESSGTLTPGSGRSRLRSLLVVSEVALAIVLLIGAGLMAKGFRRLADTYLGFDSSNLLTMRVALPESRYREAYQLADFFERVLLRAQALSGVRSAAAVSHLPALGSSASSTIIIDGRPAPRPGDHWQAEFRYVSEDYFRTLRIPLLRGRFLEAGDRSGARRAAVISESMARRFWPGQNPLEQRLRRSGSADWFTVVGVAADVQHDWLQVERRPTVYLPYLQAPEARMFLVLRAADNPVRLAPGVRAAIHSIDPDLPVSQARTFEQRLDDQKSGIRLSATHMMLFAAIALVLAAAGIYAVMAYSVTQRTHEIGVRMALGASRRDVLAMIVGQAGRLLLAGLAVGLPAALALAVLASSFVFGVVQADAATFIAFTAVLAAVALLAAYVPARRAARLDPMTALRYE